MKPEMRAKNVKMAVARIRSLKTAHDVAERPKLIR